MHGIFKTQLLEPGLEERERPSSILEHFWCMEGQSTELPSSDKTNKLRQRPPPLSIDIISSPRLSQYARKQNLMLTEVRTIVIHAGTRAPTQPLLWIVHAHTHVHTAQDTTDPVERNADSLDSPRSVDTSGSRASFQRRASLKVDAEGHPFPESPASKQAEPGRVKLDISSADLESGVTCTIRPKRVFLRLVSRLSVLCVVFSCVTLFAPEPIGHLQVCPCGYGRVRKSRVGIVTRTLQQTQKCEHPFQVPCATRQNKDGTGASLVLSLSLIHIVLQR